MIDLFKDHQHICILWFDHESYHPCVCECGYTARPRSKEEVWPNKFNPEEPDELRAESGE